ncbi:MAG: HlyD family efflux transporter periplasmic adaptor subunit [Gemmataceae bacterium]
MSDEPRRFPSFGVSVVILFIVASIAGVTWWQNQKTTERPSRDLPDLDVVCLGRVDGLERTLDLDPRMAGRVAELLVAEGQHVAAKTTLLKLDDSQLKLREEEAQAAVKAAEVEFQGTKLEEKLHPVRKAAQEAAVMAAADRVSVARRVYKEKEAARSFGTITAAELLVAESEVKQLEQLEGIEKSRRDELNLADPTLKVRAAQAKRDTADLVLKQAKKALEDCVMLAPSAGTVLRVQTSVGKSVAPSTPLPPIVFLPDGPLVIWAELEQEFLGRVKPGMKAVIRDDARSDSPKWQGTMLRVGRIVTRKRSLLLEPGEINDVRTIECVISIEGDTKDLLVGQKMRVRLGKGD